MLVLVAPLDWGLGHATRCIPLIRALEAAGHRVVACAGGAGAKLLRAEFPDLAIEEIPGHAMRYTRRRALLLPSLLAQFPAFLASMRRDGREALRLARKHGAGLIVSDGRPGFRCAAVPCVLVNHQVDPVPPGPSWARPLIAGLLRRLARRTQRRFAEVWVPDFPGPVNLSGALGHPPSAVSPGNLRYVRPLCRFRPEGTPWNRPPAETSAPGIDFLALVSGPEPQRSLFETDLLEALAKLPGTRVLVRGLPGSADAAPDVRPGALNVFDHLPGPALQALMAGARGIVCRSGYTTVMELAGLGKRGVLMVPTPGQTEQEVLAAHLRAAGCAAWRDQDALDVAGGLREAATLPGFAVWSAPGAGGDAFSLTEWVRDHPLLRG